VAGDDVQERSLRNARWRLGLSSLLVFAAGLALLIAHVLGPVGGVLAVVGVIGLNLVRAAH